MNVLDIRKVLKHQISEKPVLWDPNCSMRTDRQTDRQTSQT